MYPDAVVLERYRLVERIGVGGMGVVWLATDLLLDRPVALKRVLLADDQQAKLDRARALREARLTARLNHRHVVVTYDVCVEPAAVWLVLEYVPSPSLLRLLRELGPLDPGRVARIGAQVADALAAAHALGIEHRDITPGNVLVDSGGTVTVIDFGNARCPGHPPFTPPGTISGTYAYLAPEVARTAEFSPASDVFSLGATLYTAIEGQPPFGIAADPVEQLRIAESGIILLPAAAGEFTPLLLRLLAPDPAARPDAATARELLDGFARDSTAAMAPWPVSA